MQLERNAHEILSVEIVKTSSQDAIVKRHYTMFCHIQAADSPVSLQGEVSISVSLIRWDDGALITDEDKIVSLFVDDQKVDEVQTVLGSATFLLVFADPGTYALRVDEPLCQSAELEVTVGA